jgi:hypothetical protein
VLLAAGGLLLWGHSFVSSQVSTQLAAQKIVFPARSNPEFKALPPADAAAMGQYAGQRMTTGAQAKVYADNFIAFHLSKMGGTYSALSGESLAQPNNAKLAALVNTVFKGTTLRAAKDPVGACEQSTRLASSFRWQMPIGSSARRPRHADRPPARRRCGTAARPPGDILTAVSCPPAGASRGRTVTLFLIPAGHLGWLDVGCRPGRPVWGPRRRPRHAR